MTLGNMLESLQQVFPNLSYAQGKIDINNAIREYGQLTGLPYAEVTLAKDSAYVSFDDEKEEYLWTLPSDVYEVRKIDTQYHDEIRLNTTSMYLAYLADDVDNIRIEYVRVPNIVDALSDIPNIPLPFHMAILARVMEKWYAMNGNPAMAQYNRDIWKSGIREGLKFYNTRQWRNLASVGGSGGGTSDTNKKRVSGTGICVVAGENTINVGAPGTAVTMANSDYTLILNGNGIWVTAVDPVTGLTGRTTTTFKVWAADATCKFEYILEGT